MSRSSNSVNSPSHRLSSSGSLLVAPYTGARGRTIVDYYLEADNQIVRLLDPLRLLKSFPQGASIMVTGTPTMEKDPNAGNIPGISVQTAQLSLSYDDTPPSAADAVELSPPTLEDEIHQLQPPSLDDSKVELQPPSQDDSVSQLQPPLVVVNTSDATLYPFPSNLLPRASGDWGYNKTRRVVQKLSTIFYLVEFECGLGGGPVASIEDFSAFLFNESDSMSDYVGYCSLGKASFVPRNTLVVKMVLPCKGTSQATGNPFDATLCDSSNIVEMAYLADWTAAQQKIKHMSYVHHVLIYPEGLNSWATTPSGDPIGCSWAGKSVVGMAQGTWSYIWISGDFWKQQQLYLHEMGHNWDLGHAGAFNPTPPPSFDASQVSLANTQWIDHGDWSDAMGYCCSKRCFNAPHNWQLGWSLAATTLDSASLPFGQPQTQLLQSQAIATESFIAVVADWLPYNLSSNNKTSSLHTFFLSFRPKNDRNDVTVDGFNNGILVHIYDGKLQNRAMDSTFIGMVPSTSTFTIHLGEETSTEALLSSRSQASISDWMYHSGLVVTYLDSPNSTSHALISICRRDPRALTKPENTLEMCSDGLDNDCNGLTDDLDPACIALKSSLVVDGSDSVQYSSDLILDSPPSPNYPSRPLVPTNPPRPPRPRRSLPPQPPLGLRRSLRSR